MQRNQVKPTYICIGSIAAIAVAAGALASDVCDAEEVLKLTPRDLATPAAFGIDVAVRGDTAIVGALADADETNPTGAAYIYERRDGTWTETHKLIPSDGVTGDFFGLSVSLSGDTAIVGAPDEHTLVAHAEQQAGSGPGAAYVFTREGGTWTQSAKLTASDGAPEDRFGVGVAIDGDTAIVGAWFDDDQGENSGSAYIFTRKDGTWTETAKLLPSDGAAGKLFGFAVAINGDTVIAGGPYYDGFDPVGAAYIFTRNGGTWTEAERLLPSDGVTSTSFGNSVSINGDTAVVGALMDDDTGEDSGSAYVYTRKGDSWIETDKLIASDGIEGALFGSRVCIRGDMLIIGALADWTSVFEGGSAYLFTRQGDAWTEADKLVASDTQFASSFGQAVAIDGDAAVAGAFFHDSLFAIDVGSAYIYDIDCAPIGDIDGDGLVGLSDLLILLAEWGVCDDPAACPADLDGDGSVGVSDLLTLLANWG